MNIKDIKQKYGLRDLRGADLSGANLCKADLRETDLREADLYYANLSCANLRGANLSDANLYYANLSCANLRGANLSDANLRGANLYKADLRETDLRGADLRDANLYDADLCGADLCEADLSSADLRDANLSGVKYDLNAPSADLFGWETFTTRSGLTWVKGYRSKNSLHSPCKNTYGDGQLTEAYPWLDTTQYNCAPGIYLCATRKAALKWSIDVIEVWTLAHLIHEVGGKFRTSWVIS